MKNYRKKAIRIIAKMDKLFWALDGLDYNPKIRWRNIFKARRVVKFVWREAGLSKN